MKIKFDFTGLSEMKKFSFVIVILTFLFNLIGGLLTFVVSYYFINRFMLVNVVLGQYWLVYLNFILSPFFALIVYIAIFYKVENKIIKQPKDYVPKVHYIDHMVEKAIGGEK